MKVAYFVGPHSIRLIEEPCPNIQKPDEALVRMDCLGVCGSDAHYFSHGRIGDQVLEYPATLGHECAGTIVAVGDDVADLQSGDRVAIDPAISCGQCDQCTTGRENTCRHLHFLGSPGEAPGAAAEYRVLPARNCLKVPEKVSSEEAMLAEPLSIALHAVRLAELYAGARVGVIGCGPIGLGVIAMAKLMAPVVIYACDLLEYRCRLAEQLGAVETVVVHPHNATGLVHRWQTSEPRGLDVVFECSGDPQAIDIGQQVLIPGGMLVLVGIPIAPRVEFDIHRMRRAELTFRNVRRQRGCMMPVLRALESGQIPSHLFLTHRFAFNQIQDAFELVEDYRDGVIKAVVRIGPGE